MRRTISGATLILILIVLGVGIAFAQNDNNGFPSGPHYNLNIIGKKSGFVCPPPETDESGSPIYGNVIFVPEKGTKIEILMQSGKGAKATAIPELQVIDPCTATIDGNAALLQLPKNDFGYDVYARALAKPTDNPTMKIIPDLVMVQDENGNDLVYLGLVKSTGFQTPYVTFTRSKGSSKAVPITGLFQWTGDVCYLSEADCTGCETDDLCCTDFDSDGIYESCTVQLELVDCPAGSSTVTAYCRSYENMWVFNIGDFVTYLWDVNNDGLKLLQVRFYPRTQ